MDIPLNANVFASDGLYGLSRYVIVNPATDQITHFVMEEKGMSENQVLVPISQIRSTTPDSIQLLCSKEEISHFDPFVETEVFVSRLSREGYWSAWGYPMPDASIMSINHYKIPSGELAIRKGIRVQATDGPAGGVDEFIVDPKNGHISSLILREGHLWRKKDVSLPASELDHIDNKKVYVKLSKQQIEALPVVTMPH